MSDSNRVTLAYAAQPSFGSAPTPTPTLKEVPFTSEDLKKETRSNRSRIVRSDRMVHGLYRTGWNAGGPVNFELMYGAFDDWLAASLMSSGWSSADVVVAGGTVNFDAAAGTITVTTPASWTTQPTAGRWIEVRGADDAGNNGFFKVASATSTVITVENKDGMVTATGDTSVNIDQGAQIINGTAFTHYYLEREYTDLTNIFALLKDFTLEGFSLNVETDKEVTGAFNFLGTDQTQESATIGDASNTPFPNNEVFQVADHVPGFISSTKDQDIMAFTLDLKNALRERRIVGQGGAKSMGAGTLDLSGTLRTYFEDAEEMNAYLNFTSISLSAMLEDTAGNAYIFDVPSGRFTSGKNVTGGQDSDIIADMAWMADRDATEGAQFRIVRFAA